MFDTLTRMGAAGAGSAYEIERSLRFEGNKGNSGGVSGGASGQLDRTIQSGGSATKWTFACWFKRSQVGTTSWQNSNNRAHFFAPYRNGPNNGPSVMIIDSDDKFWFYDETAISLKTHRRFRDCSAWMHLVVAVDTSQGTDTNRVKIYFNGVQETEFTTSTYPSQDFESGWNKNQQHSIGRYAYPGSTSGALTRMGGYLAEVYFIDNQQLTPSSFGETNADTGEFVPIEYEGTYGTTGFYLDFSDNSDVTSSTLGKDRSGNDNDWTPANVTVASNNTTDSVLDTPTNNYATLNRICGRDGYFAEISDGALHAHLINGSYYQFAVATQGITSGKYYWEVTVDDSGTAGDDTKAGITVVDMDTSNQNGTPDYNRRIYYRDGEKKVSDNDSGTKTSYGASFTDGDVIGVALDMSAGTLTMYKNGSTQGVLDNTMLSKCPDSGWFPGCDGYASSNFTFNFGQQPFTHTAPAGHVHLCTANMPVPAIKDGTKHFNTLLYTGNGTTDQSKSVGFQPDLLYIKKRSHDDNGIITDNIQTPPDYLVTNSSAAAATYAEGIKSFNSTGFVLGNANNINQNTHTFVAWAWKESAGAGIDIVGYQGTGSATTHAHSLGVKPEVIIVKNRDEADGWQMYHAAMGATHTTQMDGAGIFEDDDGPWNDTEPTDSVFSVKDDHKTNADDEDYVAYLFASIPGFSKMGTYKGTGDTEGPYIYTGFRPAWIMTKRTETTPNNYWNIFDVKRDPYNSGQKASYKRIRWDSDGLEYTNHNNYTPPEIFSNGFRMIHGRADTNYDNKKFVYMAFADTPFKYANAR